MTGYLTEQLNRRLEQVQREAAAARMAPDEDGVHRLRVAVRRLIEALRVLRQGRPLRRQLRPVMRAAGETRDLDVAIRLCTKAGVSGAGEAADQLRRERARAAGRLVRRLMELEPLALVLPLPVITPAQSAMLLRRLSRAWWKAGSEAKELHAFRLRTKHLRYTLELLAPLLGRGASPRLALLRTVQEQLGALNDCKMARGFAAVRHCEELRRWLAKRQRKEQQRFAEAWAQAWRRTRGGRTWERYFAARAAADVVPGA